MEKKVKLSADQEKALKEIQSHPYIFLTGKAGTGKSFLIDQLKLQKRKVAVTATTGIAAQLIKGQTVHSFCSILPKIGVVDSRKANIRIRGCETLVVDEISMANAELIGQIFERFDQAEHEPQLILCGDFCQLPPVEGGFAFESPHWGKFHKVCLTTMHRQSDMSFINALNDLRKGQMTDSVRQLIQERKVGELPNDCTKLFPRRYQAEELNQSKLNDLPSKLKCSEWNWEYIGPTEGDDIPEPKEPTEGNTRFPKRLFLKEGARVCLLTNTDFWVNGSTGFITKINPDDVEVKLDRGGIVHVGVAEEVIYGAYGNPLYRITQIPMMLAWALTIHKCVSGETLIATDTGMRYIKEIAKDVPSGMIQNTNFGVCGKDGWRKATQIFHGLKEKSIKITTKLGYQLEGSFRHPVLICSKNGKESWKLLPKVCYGDKVGIKVGMGSCGRGSDFSKFIRRPSSQTTKDYILPLTMEDDLAWMIGILVGDGCFTNKKDGWVEFSNINRVMQKEFLRIVYKTFKLNATLRKKSERRSYFHSRPVRDFLFWLGLDYVKAGLKSVPWSIREGSISVQKAFLRGLFDTDGGINNHCVHFTSTSSKLAHEVQSLLNNLGIICVCRKLSDKKGKHNEAWRVYATGRHAVKFYHQIGFFHPSKNTRCSKQYKNYKTRIPKSNIGAIPQGNLLMEKLRDELRDLNGKAYCPGASRDFYQFVTRVIAKKVLLRYDHLDFLSGMIKDLEICGPTGKKILLFSKRGILFDEVISIKKGECEMFDLAVPEGESFVGNSIVNHNSQGMSLDQVGVYLNGHFACGQTYVAISRAKTKEGLFLQGNLDRISADQRTLAFTEA